MTIFWKRSLSMFMALAMVFSLLPMNVFAEEGTTPEETHVHAYMDGACECGATEPVATEAPVAPIEENPCTHQSVTDNVIKDNTCQEGQVEAVCDDCGTVVYAGPTPPIHNFVGNTCTDCGATCEHVWVKSVSSTLYFCRTCGTECYHDGTYVDGICTICGAEVIDVSFDLSGTDWSRAAAYGLASNGEPYQFDFVKTEGGVCYFSVDEYFPLSPEDIQKISFCEYAGGAYTDYVTFENGKTYTANDFTITDETITVYWNNSDLKLRDGGLVEISCAHGGYMGPNSTHAGGWAVAKNVNGDIYEFELPACVQNCLIWFKVEGEIYEVECIAEDDAYYPSAPSEPEVTNVAQIGETGYATLADAIAAATAGQTIELIADVNENVTIDKNLTIDGKKAVTYALRMSDAENFNYTGVMTVNPGLTVTVENVDFVGGRIAKTTKSTNGTYTIKNCTFDGNGTEPYAFSFKGAKAITIEDCTVKNFAYSFLYVPNAATTVSVKNVTVEDCPNYAVKFGSGVTNATFEDLTVKNTVSGFVINNSANREITVKNCTMVDVTDAISETGGTKTVTCTVLGENNFGAATSSENAKYVLTEGAALTAPTGAKVTNEAGEDVKYINGQYLPVTGVAMVGTQGYENLTDAIAAATAGQTITLLADIIEDVTVNKTVTIDGAGFTYTGKMNLKADTTIKNVNFDGKGYDGYAVETRGANYLTIEDCTAKNYGYGFVQLPSATVLTTVKNVVVSDVNYGVKIDYSNAVVIENAKIDAAVAAVLNSNYGEKTVTIKDSELSILGTWTRNDTIETTFLFEGANTVDQFVIDANLDSFELAEGATLTAPNDVTVITNVADREVAYNNGTYSVVEIARVAQVGENQYKTLSAAIAAATAGQTIELIADVNENVTIDKNLTIDGANFNYTGVMTANANLTVTVENVNFVQGRFAKTTKSTNGNYTIKNCTFDGKGTEFYAVNVKGARTITIENCDVKDYFYSFLYVNSSAVNVSVKDVTVENCPDYAVYFSSGVTNATFENLTVVNSEDGFVINNAANRTFTIKNCKMTGVTNAVKHAGSTNTITCTVLGNENDFGAATSSEYAKYVLTAEDATLAASAGATVTTSVENRVVDYIDGVYMVVNEIVRVAQIGETKYRTLSAAIAAAQAGDTITLLADITEDVTVTKDLTIDGANFKYTGNISVEGSTVDAIVKNVNFVDGTGYAITTNRIKSITVENCTVANYAFGFLYANKSTPTVVVKDVTVNDANYGFRWVYGTNATLENVTMTDVAHGLDIQNYAAKTINLKGCNISSIEIGERNGYSAVQTFNFVGANTVGTLSSSEYAKYVLTAENATLTAPADAAVTTSVENRVVDYIDGVYMVVTEIVRVAQIGETKYRTLSAAIAAATAGQTIELIADVNENVTIDKNLTIDGAGFNYTGVMAANDGLTVTVENVDFVQGRFAKTAKSAKGKYTIKNCTFDGNGTEPYAVNVKGAHTITIENCDVKNYVYSFLYVNSSAVNVSVKDVTVENCPDYAVYFSSGVTNATFENLTAVGSEDGFVINNSANRAFTIKNCKLTDAAIAVKTSGGTGTVTCTVLGNENDFGDATNSEYAKFVLAAEDATLTARADQNVISGVEGKVVSYQDGTYMLAEPVAQIGETGYATLAEAVAAAENGETVVILNDHALNGSKTIVEGTYGYDALVYVNGKDITLDFNGKTIEVTPAHDNMLESVVFVGNGAKLTVKGNGGFKVNECDNLYSLFYNSKSTLVIEGGNFYVAKTLVSGSLIYADKENDTTINGGVFTLVNAGVNSDTKPWIFNVHGKNEGNFVKITGGYFNQNPQLNLGTQKDCEVAIAEDRMFTLVTEGEYANYYTLSKAVARNINTNVSYATIDEAVTAAKSGETVKVVADCTAEGVIILMKGRTLDLNGHIVTAEAAVGFNTSNIVDNSAAKTARLVVDKDSFSVSSTNKQMPILTEEGYAFAAVNLQTLPVSEDKNADVNITYRPSFKPFNNLFEDGAADNGIQIKIRVSWNVPGATYAKTQDFVFGEDLVKEVYRDGRTFTLKLTGMGALENIKIVAIVESDLGVVASKTIAEID